MYMQHSQNLINRNRFANHLQIEDRHTYDATCFTWLACDVMALCRWPVLLIIVEKNKLSGVEHMLQKGHTHTSCHNAKWYDVSANRVYCACT